MSDSGSYRPPNIDSDWLFTQLLSRYPGHHKSPDLLQELVVEYIKLWRLILSYPDWRVVAPGPIVAVQQVHARQRDMYFEDCLTYFNRFVSRQDIAWGGFRDVDGAVKTFRAYQELYKNDPPAPWNDLTDAYQLKRSHLQVMTASE